MSDQQQPRLTPERIRLNELEDFLGGRINDNWYKVILDAREALGGEPGLGDIEGWVKSEAKKLRAIEFPSPTEAADRIELMISQGQEIPDELFNRPGVLQELVRRQTPKREGKFSPEGAFQPTGGGSFLSERP